MKTEGEMQVLRDEIKGQDDSVRAAKSEPERRTAIAARNAKKIELYAAEGKIPQEEVAARLKAVEFKP